MATETLTYSTTALLSAAYTALSLLSPPPQPPPPPPPQPSPSSSLPHTNHIPRTRFLVDHFSPLPQTPFAFFLSHFHSDHYTSLFPTFSRGVIFASPITADLIVRILRAPSPFVVPLPVNRTVSIDGVEVMLVDANHCPGAVQFLFRVRVWDGEFRYVHTGDFRYREEIKRELRGFVGCDAVFLDTTYCDPRYVFPGQEEVVEISQSQNRKSLNLKYSQSHGASISPGKRKRNQGSKGNKKAKVISNVEGGIKQATITNFFNKLAPVTPEGDSAGNPTTSRSSIDEVALTPSSTKDDPADPMKGKFPDNEHASLADGDKRYEEALEQFMQVTNIGESARSYATTLIERAKGEINLALDIYYNNREGYQNDNQMKLGSDSKPLLDGRGDYGCSSWQAELISSEPGKISHTYSTSTSEIVALTFVSLPMENYSPVEHACWKDGQAAPYIHLARTFDLLESEKGKIKATSMLCNMFRSLLALSPQDVLPAVYLCTNKIAPDHENMELNIGGGLVTAALVEACGTNRNKIRDVYNRLGDLGDVAQECRQTQSLLIPPPSLLIKDVFSALREISIQSGTGSTAKRKGIILGLMRSCRDKEIKFIVRTLVRNLRIGAMMKTVLPSLAQAVVMSSFASSHLGKIDDLKAQLQRVSTAVVEAYNILPNLDMLVPSLLSKGIEFSSSTLTMVPGIPIRPMLAKITNGIEKALKIFENRAFTCEYKYYN